jgi:CBS domain-containing protein
MKLSGRRAIQIDAVSDGDRHLRGDPIMKVSDAMHKGVEWVSPDTPVTKVAKKMQQLDIGAIPVGENDRLVGMVTDRDITVRGVADGKAISKLTARDVMTKGVIYCHDSDNLSDAAQIMESSHVRRLPVIDANKRMVGMLSLGDISHAGTQKVAVELARAVSAHHA